MALTGRFAAWFSNRDAVPQQKRSRDARAPTRVAGLVVQTAACRSAAQHCARDEGWAEAEVRRTSSARAYLEASSGPGRTASDAMASSARSRGGVTLKLEHSRRGLITREDHERAERLCASSMSDRCWLRRTPSGSLFAASHPVRLQAGAVSRPCPRHRPAAVGTSASRRHGTAGRPAHRRRTPSRARRPSTASC